MAVSELVWVQNLRSFIRGQVGFGDEWRDIFVERLDATVADNTRLQEALAAAEAERDAALEELGKVIMACPPGYRQGPPSADVRRLRERANAAEDFLPADSRSLPALLAETRKKALEAFGALCDQDAAYCGSEIHITCNSHSDAIERMRVAREVLAAIRALAEEVRT
ncbi:hypothetical protein J1C56_01770 [Aminobacter anthyllidis]|uniref:Uncharacterized protein n=1 Tax=Aminobacter anthyllidis TaxID=1035067 RepID=A0A9X1A7F4_9HYPH|nr:hypothetical protein [Aminobacter anthyllidis]MBT1154312.1 hypothetical protein [Aminobacter anthyllidis]